MALQKKIFFNKMDLGSSKTKRLCYVNENRTYNIYYLIFLSLEFLVWQLKKNKMRIF